MEPIISPWLFYFMGVFETIHIAFLVIGISAFVSLLLILFATWDTEGWEWSDADGRKKTKRLIKYAAAAAILFFIGSFTPSKSTITKMVVAKHITKDNVMKIIEAGGDIKNVLKKDIFEFIEKIKEKEDGNK